MHFNYLEVFCRVAQVKSFSKAAKLLHLTQPAISTQISTLEDYYAVELFTRTPQGVILTPAGEIFYRYAKEFLASHQALERELAAITSSDQELFLGASTSIGSYALPCSLWAFQEKHPGLQIKLTIANSSEILSRIENGSLELALVEGPILQQKNLIVNSATSDRLIVITPPVSPWAKMQHTDLATLSQHPLLIREPGSGIRCVLENALTATGHSLQEFKISAELGSIDAIKASVEAGAGLAIINRGAAKKELHYGQLCGLEILDFPSPITYYLVCRDQKHQTNAIKQFKRFICGPGEKELC